MNIRFWGTRGSLAKPGRTTLRHGGNTSCVEVRGDDGTLIVLDCGTGAHGLGQNASACAEKFGDGLRRTIGMASWKVCEGVGCVDSSMTAGPPVWIRASA
jgi:hypothetical protein